VPQASPRAFSGTAPIDTSAILGSPLFTGAAPPPPAPPGPAPSPQADPLVGTVSRMNLTTTTLREPAAALPLAAAPLPAPGGAPVARTRDRSLRWVAAALSVLLLGIVLALISVLRTSPGNVSPAATPPSASAATPAPPPRAPSASPPPAAPPEPPPAPSASASAAEPPAHTSAPAKPPPPRAPRGPARQKLQQLGSGL
jgi:hypothetical protein